MNIEKRGEYIRDYVQNKMSSNNNEQGNDIEQENQLISFIKATNIYLVYIVLAIIFYMFFSFASINLKVNEEILLNIYLFFDSSLTKFPEMIGFINGYNENYGQDILKVILISLMIYISLRILLFNERRDSSNNYDLLYFSLGLLVYSFVYILLLIINMHLSVVFYYTDTVLTDKFLMFVYWIFSLAFIHNAATRFEYIRL